jgi:hypothetical protein
MSPIGYQDKIHSFVACQVDCGSPIQFGPCERAPLSRQPWQHASRPAGRQCSETLIQLEFPVLSLSAGLAHRMSPQANLYRIRGPEMVLAGARVSAGNIRPGGYH